MRIAIIGSGGREHSICQKIYESKISKKEDKWLKSSENVESL